VKKKDSLLKRLSESFSGSKKSFKQPDFEFSTDENHDSDELQHNCHSDVDIYRDFDIAYEYDKCN